MIMKNINIILIVCILVLITYLVTSNEKFTMRVLENKPEINSNFDFVSIVNIIKTNLNNLNTITNQERQTYNELIKNIEAKQNDGYIFDIDYIGNNILSSTTTTTPSTIPSTTTPSTTTPSTTTPSTTTSLTELFVSIPKVAVPETNDIMTVKLESNIEKFYSIPSSIYDRNGCNILAGEVKIVVGKQNTNSNIKDIEINKNIISIKKNDDGKLIRANADFNFVDDKFDAKIIEQPEKDKNVLRITRDVNGWGMNLAVCGIVKTTTTTIPNTTIPTTTIPTTTIPNTTISNTTIPNTTIPNTTIPNTTIPNTTTSIPNTTTSIPNTTIPTTTIPTTTIPTTTIPTTTIPTTTISTTTIPTTTRPIGSPKGYILLSENQVKFLRYFVFLSLIRGVFDQLNKVNNYYYDATGTNNNKYVNENHETLCGNEEGLTKTVNGRDIIGKCLMSSMDRGYPSIVADVTTSVLPNVNVVGNMPLLNIYVDVIEKYINTGLCADNIMKKILSVKINNSRINLKNQIETVVNDLIQEFHKYGLYYVNEIDTERNISSYQYNLTI